MLDSGVGTGWTRAQGMGRLTAELMRNAVRRVPSALKETLPMEAR